MNNRLNNRLTSISFFFADARATVRIFLNATVTVTLLMCLLSAKQSETRACTGVRAEN